MILIALLGKRASVPSRGVAPLASWRKVILTVTPVAPIALARFAMKTIQRLPIPSRLIPAAFWEAVLLPLTRPQFL